MLFHGLKERNKNKFLEYQQLLSDGKFDEITIGYKTNRSSIYKKFSAVENDRKKKSQNGTYSVVNKAIQ